ncbi:MAG: sensor domain-containing diguanylate cyclase [Pseudomonadota bacterium]
MDETNQGSNSTPPVESGPEGVPGSAERPARSRGGAESAIPGLEEVRGLYRGLMEKVEEIHQANERAYKRIRTIRHLLIGSRGLAEFFRILIEELGGLEVDQTVVSLAEETVDPNRPSIVNLPESIRKKLRFLDRETLRNMIFPAGRMEFHIGPVSDQAVAFFLDDDIESCVIAPLIFHDALMGCLHLGSRSAERFPADHSLDLIEDLAVTAALCLDNAATHERNEELASTDALTGVANRRSFFQCSSRAMALSRRHGDDLACIYLDLDEFKPINDAYGHETGDRVLKTIAGFIKSRLRRTDIFARLGGDEFAILLPRVNLNDARNLVRTLKEGIKNIHFPEGAPENSKISASFGVAALSPLDESLTDLIGRADQAMYEEKNQRRQKQPRDDAA